MSKWIEGAVLLAGIAVSVGAGTTAYFYNRTMKRNNANVERTMKMAGTDWSQHMPFIEARKEFMLAWPHEDMYIESDDGLKLHATWFPGCEAEPAVEAGTEKTDKNKQRRDGAEAAMAATDVTTQKTGDAKHPEDKALQKGKKVVICFHGYTSKGMSDYIGLSGYYLKRGYGMLLVDERAHGESEGKYIGFGCLDRHDALKWIRWVTEKVGEDVQILLHGTSMGASTVLMASGLSLPEQVKGIVSDCAFTSPKHVFTHVLHSMYHLPAFPMIPVSDAVNKRKAGYGLDECNAAREVKKAKVPILFIHGDADTFVPCSMCDEIYENCASPKTKLIIKGAAHAESYYKDPEAYEKALDAFTEGLFQ
ncbi:MAG: alpha/beta hydrolase [Clostridiales bacterium]|nr:alpha/beta hydrolase [Clostridiales bacterium]